jgi:hypothetical protein
MKRAVLMVAFALLASAACQPENEDKPQAAAPSGGGGGAPPQGGGGDVLVAPEDKPAPVAAKARPDLEGRYERALKRIHTKDYDSAYLELASILTEAPDSDTASKAAKDLEQVQGQLLSSPTTPAGDLLAKPAKFQDKPVSVRGAFRPGGPAGDAGEYFFIDAEGGRLKCRYSRLHADAKKAISTLPTGSKLLMRGYMRSAGTDNYLDISLFKIES